MLITDPALSDLADASAFRTGLVTKVSASSQKSDPSRDTGRGAGNLIIENA